jgi:hypothetical protein
MDPMHDAEETASGFESICLGLFSCVFVISLLMKSIPLYIKKTRTFFDYILSIDIWVRIL